MNVEERYRDLVSAVSLTTDRAAVRLRTTYQGASGPGGKVFPPTYPSQDGGQYVLENRFVNGEERQSVLVDSVPSHANRAEEALLRARRAGRIETPLLELHHEGQARVVLSSLEFPHRYADAYLRDSLLEGVPFDTTELGISLVKASPEDATGLYRHDPGSLVFGAWNSHRRGQQYKFPRIYSGEIIGWDPVVGARRAGRMDPLNLTGAATRTQDGEGWEYDPVVRKQKTRGNKLSEIGHGHVAPGEQHGGVTVSSVTRTATLSLAGLDRIGFGTATAARATAARAVLASYALVADRLAFAGPGLWLRSGCDLVVVSEEIAWVCRGGVDEPFELSAETAIEVFEHAVRKASEAGLPWDTRTVRLTPSRPLAAAIDQSLARAEPVQE
jgi:CRISPR-associated protein Csb1